MNEKAWAVSISRWPKLFGACPESLFRKCCLTPLPPVNTGFAEGRTTFRGAFSDERGLTGVTAGSYRCAPASAASQEQRLSSDCRYIPPSIGGKSKKLQSTRKEWLQLFLCLSGVVGFEIDVLVMISEFLAEQSHASDVFRIRFHFDTDFPCFG